MQFMLVVLAIVALTHTGVAEWKASTAEDIRLIKKECLSEHPVSDDVINKLKHAEFTDDEQVRKFLLCEVEKLGVFTDTEGYNVQRTVQQFKMDLEESETLTIVEGCVAKTPADTTNANYVYRVQTCLASSKIGERIKAYFRKEAEKKSA